MGEDSLFDLFPDMDMDGDRDVIDFLLFDEMENEIQREIDEQDKRVSGYSFDDDNEDDLADLEDLDDLEEITQIIPLYLKIEFDEPVTRQQKRIIRSPNK